MRILELYSGIGGMHYALKESNVHGEVVTSVEISTVANQVYKHNFPNVNLINRNIESLTVDEINRMKIDSIFMSPPCQPFTKNGLQKDNNDPRTLSFFYILKLIPQLSNLKYILLENVVPFETSNSRNELINCLENNEFNYKDFILTPRVFGIPNNRSRYYLIGKKNNLPFCLSNFPSRISYQDMMNVLSEIYLTNQIKNDENKNFKLKDIIENDEKININEFKLPIALIKKYLNVFDIRNLDSTSTCCFTSAYSRYAEGTGSIFSNVNQKEFEENIKKLKSINCDSEEWMKIASNLNLRYFTPKEISRLMSFPNNFSLPSSISNKQCYKLIGNSLNVYVVSRLILLLYY